MLHRRVVGGVVRRSCLRGRASAVCPLSAFSRPLSCTAPTMDVAATPGSPFLITTPIFYVNAEPHLGHLFTAVLADAGARWARLKGHDVIFATGTDEHGLKVQHAADAKGVSAQAFCDTTSARFRSLFDQAGISYDRFVRTTDADHVEMVSSVWQELQRKGLIRMGHHEGWYCEGDEAFLTSQQVRKATAEDAAVLGVTLPDDGDADAEPVMVSTESGRVVERVAEENYVFCLSQFEDVLQQWIRRHETTTALDDGTATAAAVIPTVVPSVRRREVCNMLKERLRDLSVSRLSCNVEWGIPVPGDATHTVYVWLDALVNYLTVTGRTLPELLAAGDDDHVHWPGTHVVGKDILKFHAIYWPAFLAGLGLPLPERVVAHGHWIVDNVKMSKSLGNVVDPYALLERHGRDESRYFLLQEGALQYDAQFSHERVEERRRTELVSKLGNLVSRATAPVLLPNRVMPCALPEQWLTADDVAFLECVQSTADSVATLYDELNFHQALGLVVELMNDANRYFDTQTPWLLKPLADDDPECKDVQVKTKRLRTVLWSTQECLRVVGILLQPVIPEACQRMLDHMGVPARERDASYARVRAVTVGDRVISDGEARKFVLFPAKK